METHIWIHLPCSTLAKLKNKNIGLCTQKTKAVTLISNFEVKMKQTDECAENKKKNRSR